MRQRYWAHAAVWTACIYSTLYVARPVCEFLKETTPFAGVVNLALGGALVWITGVFCSGRRLCTPSHYFVLVFVLLCYVYGLMKIPHPEEKIHFVEYGVLAYFIWRALRIDCRKWQTYGWAFVLTAILGWIDEGIQHLLPNRYYQTGDVFLNGMSGLLALGLVYVFQGEAVS